MTSTISEVAPTTTPKPTTAGVLPPGKKVLTLQEFMDLLQIERQSAMKLFGEGPGKVPAKRVGPRLIRILVEDVERFLNEAPIATPIRRGRRRKAG